MFKTINVVRQLGVGLIIDPLRKPLIIRLILMDVWSCQMRGTPPPAPRLPIGSVPRFRGTPGVARWRPIALAAPENPLSLFDTTVGPTHLSRQGQGPSL